MVEFQDTFVYSVKQVVDVLGTEPRHLISMQLFSILRKMHFSHKTCALSFAPIVYHVGHASLSYLPFIEQNLNLKYTPPLQVFYVVALMPQNKNSTMANTNELSFINAVFEYRLLTSSLLKQSLISSER